VTGESAEADGSDDVAVMTCVPLASAHDVEPEGAVVPARHAVHAVTAPAVAVNVSAGHCAHEEAPAKYCPAGHVFTDEHDWPSADENGKGDAHGVHAVAPGAAATESAAHAMQLVAVDGDDENEPALQAVHALPPDAYDPAAHVAAQAVAPAAEKVSASQDVQ
jgi:hypothetical protein